MAIRAPDALVDDISLYPLHEEDDVPETPPHRRRTVYLYDALTARFPQWHVISNACIYWAPGDTETYVAPDVFVVKGRRTAEAPRVHRTWIEPPVIFVAEIGSRSTFRQDRGPKLETYRDHVKAEEYLYTDPVEDQATEALTPGHLHFWRRTAAGYVEVEPATSGRFRSEQLDLEIGVDEAGELRLYTSDGERVLTYEEEHQAREAAEVQARTEARERLAAQHRASEAEQRALAAEAQTRELKRQLTELQSRLAQDEG
jgi:Uma2 family endonuclease